MGKREQHKTHSCFGFDRSNLIYISTLHHISMTVRVITCSSHLCPFSKPVRAASLLRACTIPRTVGCSKKNSQCAVRNSKNIIVCHNTHSSKTWSAMLASFGRGAVLRLKSLWFAMLLAPAIASAITFRTRAKGPSGGARWRVSLPCICTCVHAATLLGAKARRGVSIHSD